MRSGGGAAWYWWMSSLRMRAVMRHDGQRLEAFCSGKRKGVCASAESGTMEALALTSKGVRRKGMLYTRAAIERPVQCRRNGRLVYESFPNPVQARRVYGSGPLPFALSLERVPNLAYISLLLSPLHLVAITTQTFTNNDFLLQLVRTRSALYSWPDVCSQTRTSFPLSLVAHVVTLCFSCATQVSAVSLFLSIDVAHSFSLTAYLEYNSPLQS